MSLSKKAILVIIIILIIDQTFKIIVKTTMSLGETQPVFGNWFLIRFIENPGMAFGIDIPGKLGKPSLTIFRIIAVVLIGFYLRSIIQKKAPFGFIVCFNVTGSEEDSKTNVQAQPNMTDERRYFTNIRKIFVEV